MKFGSRHLTTVVAVAVGLVLISSIAAPVSASTGKGNALEDRGQRGVTDTGLCLADLKIHEQFGFLSPQDRAFHNGLTQGGIPVASFLANCPHLAP
jgi:hypothetical protein